MKTGEPTSVESIDQLSCNGCTGCVHRCTEGIALSREEHAAMRNQLAGMHPAERERVLAQPKTRSWPGAGGEALYTACRFLDLDTGLCIVYEARPLVCRLFGHVEWLPCPLSRVKDTWPSGHAAMEGRASIDLHTWDEWENLSL